MDSIESIFDMNEDQLKDKFTSLVKSELTRKYSLSTNAVEKILNNSIYSVLLEEDASFVYTFGAEYWADEMAKVFDKLNQ